MYTLLLTLGHNSSAVLVNREDPTDIIGYEEERITEIKSDSAFPGQALYELARRVNFQLVDEYMVSHWFDNFDITEQTKYWTPGLLEALCPNIHYRDMSERMSHHDMHAYSALAFTEHFIKVNTDWHCMVVDGFGTHQEVISLYRVSNRYQDRELMPVFKVHGFRHSLGLMFQYAAEACGMDGINDVYKFLGYRTKVTTEEAANLDNEAASIANKMYRDVLFNSTAPIKGKDLIDYETLKEVKKMFMSFFHQYRGDRAAVGYLVQSIIERVICDICEHFGVTSLMAAGGCFLNVRLNGVLRNQLSRISIMPIAGDQGAALGAYRFRYGSKSLEFGNFCWGPRREESDPTKKIKGFSVYKSFKDSSAALAHLLNLGAVVNVIRPNMEFGPRALCRTSTLALPTTRNVEFINYCNGRNTVMPMAPVVTYESAHCMFDSNDLFKVIGTDQFMVCAHDYAIDPGQVEGAALNENGVWTGRPQILKGKSDSDMSAMLREIEHGCLINTSFNGHGSPIIFSMQQAIRLHEEWTRRAKDFTDPPKFMTMYFRN